MAEDIVFFLMPDGTKVSNDPRWLMDQGKSLAELLVEGTPNTGHATPHAEDEEIAKGQTDASNSFGNFAPVTGRMLQHEDRKAANEGEYDENNPEFTAEPIDINERILEARKNREEAALAEYEARAEAGDEDAGDPSKPYSEWNAAALKSEVKRRRAAGRNIDLPGKAKKADVEAALQADDLLQDQSAAADLMSTGSEQ